MQLTLSDFVEEGLVHVVKHDGGAMQSESHIGPRSSRFLPTGKLESVHRLLKTNRIQIGFTPR